MKKRIMLGLLVSLVLFIILVPIGYVYFFMVLPYPSVEYLSRPNIGRESVFRDSGHRCTLYYYTGDFITSDVPDKVISWLEARDWHLAFEEILPDAQIMRRFLSFKITPDISVNFSQTRIMDLSYIEGTKIKSQDSLIVCTP